MEERRNAEDLVGVVLAQANGTPINITNLLGVRGLGQISSAFGLSNLSNFHRLAQGDPERQQQQPQHADQPSGTDPSSDAVEMEIGDHDRITFAEGSPYITLSKDRMSAWPKSSTNFADKAMASISSTLRWNRQLEVAYYEVSIGRREGGIRSSLINAPSGSGVVVGVTASRLAHTRTVGSVASSFGYKGSNGSLFAGLDEGREFGPPFRAGDTIGCGIAYESGRIFFTRNGTFLGEAGSFVGSLGVYPAVSMPLESEDIVTANFGREPFKFDVSSYIAELAESKRNVVAAMPVASPVAHALVKNYLIHSGYASVYEKMVSADVATGKIANNNEGDDTMLRPAVQHRENVRRHVIQGEVVKAMAIISETWPNLIETLASDEEKSVWLELHYQQYIELIREHKVLEALHYMRGTLNELVLPSSELPLLIDLEGAHGLIAYKDPETSRAAHLLSQDRRHKVADITNSLLLSYDELDQIQSKKPGGKMSSIERLLKHLSQVEHMRHDIVNKGSGRPFDLGKFLATSS